MNINNVTKYLKFANVQMAAESLFRLGEPATIKLRAQALAGSMDSNTRQPQGRIVLRGAHMNEKGDSMEKQSTPTPGAPRNLSITSASRPSGIRAQRAADRATR